MTDIAVASPVEPEDILLEVPVGAAGRSRIALAPVTGYTGRFQDRLDQAVIVDRFKTTSVGRQRRGVTLQRQRCSRQWRNRLPLVFVTAETAQMLPFVHVCAGAHRLHRHPVFIEGLEENELAYRCFAVDASILLHRHNTKRHSGNALVGKTDTRPVEFGHGIRLGDHLHDTQPFDFRTLGPRHVRFVDVGHADHRTIVAVKAGAFSLPGPGGKDRRPGPWFDRDGIHGPQPVFGVFVFRNRMVGVCAGGASKEQLPVAESVKEIDPIVIVAQEKVGAQRPGSSIVFAECRISFRFGKADIRRYSPDLRHHPVVGNSGVDIDEGADRAAVVPRCRGNVLAGGIRYGPEIALHPGAGVSPVPLGI